MSYNESFENVADFERRLLSIDQPENEKFIRELMRDIMEDCPLHLVRHLGRIVVLCRKAELREEGQAN